MEDYIERLTKIFEERINNLSVRIEEKSQNRRQSIGLLFEGVTGVGKTALLKEVERRAPQNTTVKYFDCSKITDADLSKSAAEIFSVMLAGYDFQKQRTLGLSSLYILLLDNIDACAPNLPIKNLHPLHVLCTSTIASAFDILNNHNNTFIIATSSSPIDSKTNHNEDESDVNEEIKIHSSVAYILTRSFRFGTPIIIQLPNKSNRINMLMNILLSPEICISLEGHRKSTVPSSGESTATSREVEQKRLQVLNFIETVANRMEGFTPADIISVIRRSVQPKNLFLATTHSATANRFDPSVKYILSSADLLQQLTTYIPLTIPPSLLPLFLSQNSSSNNDNSNSSSSSGDSNQDSVVPKSLFGETMHSHWKYLRRAVLAGRMDDIDPVYASRCRQLQIEPCSGVLITGGAGTGKTALAQALIASCVGQYRFLSVSCADMVHKVVGESEQRLASVFSAARRLAPCLLLLDNLDALFQTGTHGDSSQPGARSRTSHAALDRLLSTLLVEIDGLESTGDIERLHPIDPWQRFSPPGTSTPAPSTSTISAPSGGVPQRSLGEEGRHVVVVATCSSLANIDRALVRPGRLEEHIHLTLPNHNERVDILKGCLDPLLRKRRDKKGVTDTTDDLRHDDMMAVSCDAQIQLISKTLADQTDGRSPAELLQLVQEGAMRAIRESISSGKEVALDTRHFI